MTSTTPYMIRAIYDWCTDEGFTAHILVDAEQDGVVVPVGHIADGAIILNLGSNAVKMLELGNEWILFSARFGGVPMDVNVPVHAVRAIYAKENGEGCAFPEKTEPTFDELGQDDLGELEASDLGDSELGESELERPVLGLAGVSSLGDEELSEEVLREFELADNQSDDVLTDEPAGGVTSISTKSKRAVKKPKAKPGVNSKDGDKAMKKTVDSVKPSSVSSGSGTQSKKPNKKGRPNLKLVD